MRHDREAAAPQGPHDGPTGVPGGAEHVRGGGGHPANLAPRRERDDLRAFLKALYRRLPGRVEIRAFEAETGKPAGRRFPKASDLEHCPFCSPHANEMAPPPAPSALPLAPVRAEAVPALFLAAPRPLHAWTSAQPRAPPLAS